MPIFEYKCKLCKKEFEELILSSDSEIKFCKYCNGKIIKKISLGTFKLKGTGWYVTDYGQKNNQSSHEKN